MPAEMPEEMPEGTVSGNAGRGWDGDLVSGPGGRVGRRGCGEGFGGWLCLWRRGSHGWRGGLWRRG